MPLPEPCVGASPLSLSLGTAFVLVGCSLDRSESPERDEATFREHLLSATPTGSAATNVLKFVVDELQPKQRVGSYYKYVDALQAGRTGRLNVQPINPPTPALPMPSDWPKDENYPPRQINVYIKTYSDGSRLLATWTFDKNDTLLRIYVGRDSSP